MHSRRRPGLPEFIEGREDMKNLKLVFDNTDGERKDITLPMEKWIADWWYECNIVPQNDTAVLNAELDGESILDDIKAGTEGDIPFEEVAWHFKWDSLHDDFIGAVKGNEPYEDNSADFEKWLNTVD